MEDIIQLYQEAIALIRLRNGGIELVGEYDFSDDGFFAFVLKYPANGKMKKIVFKYMKNTTEALSYFIKCSQNINKLR